MAGNHRTLMAKPIWRYKGNQMWVLKPINVGWHFPRGNAWPWRHMVPLSAHVCQCRVASKAGLGDDGMLSWRLDIVGGGV